MIIIVARDGSMTLREGVVGPEPYWKWVVFRGQLSLAGKGYDVEEHMGRVVLRVRDTAVVEELR